ncbi:MAG: hypothetical protein ABSC51_00345 [Gaiellaceae bacterium]
MKDIVDQARHEPESKPQRRPLRSRAGYLGFARIVTGLVMFAAGISGLGYSLVKLMHIGTCASGNTPYVIARQCPSGTGAQIGLLAGAIFVALIGVAIAAIGLAIPGGIGFTAIGVVALYGGLTAPGSAAGAATAGYIVGTTFIVMGLSYLAWAIAGWRSSRSNTEPMLSAVGISQLINATAPKPRSAGEPSKDDDQTSRGG